MKGEGEEEGRYLQKKVDVFVVEVGGRDEEVKRKFFAVFYPSPLPPPSDVTRPPFFGLVAKLFYASAFHVR